MLHKSKQCNINDIRQGRQAREVAVCQHYEQIFNFMAYLSGDRTVAEDLTQETFSSAWAKIDSCKGSTTFKSWLYRIAYHKFIDSKRQLTRSSAFTAKLIEQGGNINKSPDPLDCSTSNEEAGLLYEAMAKLKPTEYVVIVLHYVQGLSFREMAKVLDRSVGTIKWRTSRALKKLKGILLAGYDNDWK